MAEPKQHAAASEQEAPTLATLPDEVLVTVLQHLAQRERARAALCCARWAHLCRTSPVLWESVALQGLLPASRSLQRVEGFLAWLIPRAAGVQSLTIAERRSELATDPVLWGNCVSAITLLGPQLRQLTLEWPAQLTVSGWAGALRALRVASFNSDHVVVREGLHRLTALTELRLKSSRVALTLQPTAARSILPLSLLRLRMEECNLGFLPPAVLGLTGLEDLVLSDNVLRDADMQGLSCLASLRQLTLMGCRLRQVPPSLSQLHRLQVLYLDMGIAGPPEEPIHTQVAAALGPLCSLGILSLGACYLQEFPASLTALTSLRALYVDDNAISTLPDGPYLSRLCVLGIDWRVLLRSHRTLLRAPRLRKLAIMSIGKDVDAAPRQPEVAAAVVDSLTSHPSLRQVLLPQVDGQRCRLHVVVLNVIIGCAHAAHLQVQAVGYQGIGNEWLQWLEEELAREALQGKAAKGPPARGSG